MILEMILYETLHREIILNLVKEEGLESLGIKAKKEEFIAPPILDTI